MARDTVTSGRRVDRTDRPALSGRPSEEARPEIRLCKMVTKDIGILYYGLPQSSNPHSVVYNRILGIEELDAVGEQF